MKRLVLMLMLVPPAAQAQLFQNLDMSWLAGPSFARTQAIGNSGVTLFSAPGFAWASDFGYQFHRVGGASLWLDLPFVSIDGSHQTATIPGAISASAYMIVPGVRLMLPLTSRISAFTEGGVGEGSFSYPAIQTSRNPPLTTNNVNHGVVDFGGGVNIRLSRFFSIRVDVRDFVTGRNLAGEPGRNHVLPMVGIVIP